MNDARVLKVFIGERDRFEGRPLYQALAEKAREVGLAGCTVTRGVLGYGAASRIHTATILALSEDLPLIVEIVDVEEKIQDFLPLVDSMVKEGLVTIEPVKVLIYRHQRQS